MVLSLAVVTVACGGSDDPSIQVPEGSSTTTTMDSTMPGMDH